MGKSAGFVPHEAAFAGDIPGIEKFLLTNPDSADVRTEDGDTLLHMACWGKQLGVVGILIAQNADVNAIGCYGRVPLHYAVHEGRQISVPLVVTLLNEGADPSIKDDNGFTPADWARVEMGDEGLKEVLEVLDSKRGQ